MQTPETTAPENENGRADPRINRPGYSHLDLAGLANHGGGTKSPFDKSFLNAISKTLAKHGPAFAKLSLIAGSATATVYNALRAGTRPEVLNGDLVFLILTAAGLIVECGFAYAWSRRGSYDLAGEQRAVADKIFNRSSFIMIGDLSLSVAELAFGVGNIAIFWIGIVQPVFAVHIVRLFYKLKGLHPEYLAEMRVVDMRAQMKAAEILDAAEELAFELQDRSHERDLRWIALDERHSSGLKLVTSRWFRRQVRKAVKASVGYRLLGELRDRAGNLPNLLGIGRGEKIRRSIQYPCVYCGRVLRGQQRKYHDKCRRRADEERRARGTDALPNYIQRICVSPECSNVLAGRQRRHCSKACKQASYRRRQARKKRRRAT